MWRRGVRVRLAGELAVVGYVKGRGELRMVIRDLGVTVRHVEVVDVVPFAEIDE